MTGTYRYVLAYFNQQIQINNMPKRRDWIQDVIMAICAALGGGGQPFTVAKEEDIIRHISPPDCQAYSESFSAPHENETNGLIWIFNNLHDIYTKR